MTRFASFVAALVVLATTVPAQAKFTSGKEPVGGYSQLEIGKRNGQLGLQMEHSPLVVGDVAWPSFDQISVQADRLGEGGGYKVLTLSPLKPAEEANLGLPKSYSRSNGGRQIALLSSFDLSPAEQLNLVTLVTTLKSREKDLVAAYKGDNIDLSMTGTYAVYIYDGKSRDGRPKVGRRRGPIIVIDRSPK